MIAKNENEKGATSLKVSKEMLELLPSKRDDPKEGNEYSTEYVLVRMLCGAFSWSTFPDSSFSNPGAPYLLAVCW
jgi:hypothetical protein